MQHWRSAAIAAGLLAGAGALWLAAEAPERARARAQEELRAALGAESGLGTLEFDGSTLVVRDLVVAASGARVELDALRLSGDPLSLLRRDAPALRSAEAQGGTITLSAEALGGLLAGGAHAAHPAAGAEAEESAGSTPAGVAPAALLRRIDALLDPEAVLRARGLRVRWIDAAGVEHELAESLELVVAPERIASEALHARIAFEARGVTLRHARLHDGPVSLPPLRGRARVQWSEEALRIEESLLELDGVRLDLDARVEWRPEGERVDLHARLLETDCGEALGTLPTALRGPFADASLGGRISGAVALVADLAEPDLSRFEVEADERCRIESVPNDVQLARYDAPFTHTVRGHEGEVLHRFRTGPGHPRWTRLADTSPFLVHAVLAHEDASFLDHAGFAPWAIETALQRNLAERRFAVGASTISMQLAKNLFLERSKRLDRKLQEVLLTWWLEERLGKREILELYLNVIEYGPGIFGLRDAADHYFGRAPAELSPAESAFLASLLPGPGARHASCSRDELSRFMRREMEGLLDHMHQRERIDGPALAQARAELDDFRFRGHGGGAPLPARGIQGEAAPLPFATAAVPRDPPPPGGLGGLFSAFGDEPAREPTQRAEAPGAARR